MIRRRIYLIGSFLFLWSALLHAQFGGRPGDAVLYMVTAKGNGDFRALPPPAANDPQTAARFYTTRLDSVPPEPSDPFPFLRQTLYEAPDETFLFNHHPDPSRGIHRLVLAPIKVFGKMGILSIPGGTALPGIWLNIPPGIDLEGDVSLIDVDTIFWSPMKFPFIQQTDTRGPNVPPGQTGFGLLVSTPGLLKITSLMPFVNFSAIYPGSGWPNGVDMKLIDVDPQLGDTIRLVRIRPGKTTPIFRIAGHTHLFVLQGSATITPAGSASISLKSDDYAFLPENFAVTLSNPKRYQGPGAP